MRNTRVRAYAAAVLAVAAATLIGIAADVHVGLADEAMLFLLAITISSPGGRGPALTASTLSVASFDFFFVEPRFTFAVADARTPLTFVMMFVVGMAMSTLLARLRERERRTAALAEAAREAAYRVKAEELRNALLSSVSHDLRTPLAVITGMASTLRSTDPAQQDAIETIIDETQRLSRIVTNVIAVTRVENGGAARREWVPLEELVGAALGRLDHELEGHPVAVEVATDVYGFVDPILVDQLLVNLLENAARHTPPGTAIEVRATRDRRGATLEVSDHGPGLPAGTTEIVFDKFFRGRDATGRGAGLGLAVCRGIAHAHRGEIAATERAGGGASFRVEFPDDGVPADLGGPA